MLVTSAEANASTSPSQIIGTLRRVPADMRLRLSRVCAYLANYPSVRSGPEREWLTGGDARPGCWPEPAGWRMDLLMPDAPGTDPAMCLALEEALVRAVPPAPVLRIWQNDACVVLGRGQRLEREVNLAAATA